MHPEYVKVSQIILTALRSARLDDAVEVEGPSKLGGWLLRDGGRRVALARLPGERRSRGESAPLWYVSAWYELYDEMEEAVEGVDFTRQREVILGTTPSTEDAVIAAIKVLVEGRIEDGLREARAASESDAPPPEAAEKKRRFPVWGTARRNDPASSRSLASRV
jgi:hypothetical protein